MCRLEPGSGEAEAIVWAMEEGHTTRTDGVPGGLGLFMLTEFIESNDGKLLLVSGRGYLEIDASVTQTATLHHPFPGTVAYLLVRTDVSCYDAAHTSTQTMNA